MIDLHQSKPELLSLALSSADPDLLRTALTNADPQLLKVNNGDLSVVRTLRHS